MTNMENEVLRAESMGLDLEELSDLNLVRHFSDDLRAGRFNHLPSTVRFRLTKLGIMKFNREPWHTRECCLFLTSKGDAMLTELEEELRHGP